MTYLCLSHRLRSQSGYLIASRAFLQVTCPAAEPARLALWISRGFSREQPETHDEHHARADQAYSSSNVGLVGVIDQLVIPRPLQLKARVGYPKKQPAEQAGHQKPKPGSADDSVHVCQ